ncbi:hypothetical protein SCHPADRAFT_483819 [Schizopora paradoxa]|uniref:Uncharacterized protein n=1 Tax=Schizopora paradoxa TaxID=27342 RepID=A0A0H2RHS7_9AGAM|nr:hypothetical protein SCHPADRAFT_483819 [Schizopora paradoxa]
MHQSNFEVLKLISYIMSNNLEENLSGYQRGARNRTHDPCDQCVHDRRKCELQGGVPCVRCVERQRDCTINGQTKAHYNNLLVQENGNQPPFLFGRLEGDGYLALMTINGELCLQHLTPHFVKAGPPRYVDPQVRIA